MFVPGEEAHCRRVFEVWTSPWRRGRMPDDVEDPPKTVLQTVGYVGVRLHDARGVVVEQWGVPQGEGGAPHFAPLRHLTEGEWVDCAGCRRLVSMGQLVSLEKECSACTYASDPWRRWPRYEERGDTMPRPTKCVRCGSGTVKGRQYLPGLGWHCEGCGADARVAEAQRRSDGRAAG